jgi:8-oxo-dGTP pyrophosphatase MutT (NUDIX family)
MNSPGMPSPFYRVSVKALVSDGEGRLLVLQNRDHTWELPGGGWEHGETLEQCVRREIEEELGVTVAAIDSSLVHPSVGIAPNASYPWLKLALPVRLDGERFSFGGGDERMRAARYMTLAQFAAVQTHRSDRCLQRDAERLWELVARSALTAAVVAAAAGSPTPPEGMAQTRQN